MIDLTERVTFYKNVDERQPTGEVISTFEEQFTTWTEVNVLSGKEKYDAQGKLVYRKYSFKIRKRDIDEQSVIKFNDTFYDISSIEPMFSEQRERFQYIEANYITDKDFNI